MLAIIDIASSGLGPESFPISIAWCVLNTSIERHLLIRPAPNWQGWERESEEVHGITRQQLLRDGQPVEHVALALQRELAGARIFSYAPALDQAWLDRLFAEAPGSSGLSIRRYRELFPGASAKEIAAALDRVDPVPTEFKSLADARRLAAVAELYLGNFQQAAG